MKNVGFDLTREFIVQRDRPVGDRYRTVLTSVSQLLPEVYDHISLGHLGPDIVAALVAFCGTTEFAVVEVAVLPWAAPVLPPAPVVTEGMYAAGIIGFQDAGGCPFPQVPDCARIILRPFKNSDFGASFLNCQSLLQAGPPIDVPGTPSEQEIGPGQPKMPGEPGRPFRPDEVYMVADRQEDVPGNASRASLSRGERILSIAERTLPQLEAAIRLSRAAAA